MDLAQLQNLLEAVSGVRVACVGDVMVDRFVYGEVSRTSPEAPIPVLHRAREQREHLLAPLRPGLAVERFQVLRRDGPERPHQVQVLGVEAV